MRRAARFLALACAMVLALATGRAAAQDSGPPTMIIAGPGSQLSTIAVSGLKSLGGDDDHRVGNAFVNTLRRDLDLSGYFRIIDPHAYIEDPQSSGFELGQFNFADWRSINADFVVKGSTNVGSDGVKLTAYLYDVAQQRRMMGKNYSGDAGDVPRMARRFADAILEAATGQSVRQKISLQQGIPADKAKEIVRIVKDSKKKVQASIQGDTVRISGKDRDDLQAIIAALRGKDLGVELTFTNYRTN